MNNIYSKSLAELNWEPILDRLGTYRIYNRLTNKSYVGLCSKYSFWSRWSCGKLSHIYNIDNITSNSAKWYLELHNTPKTEIFFEILCLDDDRELEFINKFDSFYNGYNQTLDGKGGLSGRKFVTNGVIDKVIKSTELEEFLESNKDFYPGTHYNKVSDSFTTLGMISVTDGKSNKMIMEVELDQFLKSNPTYRKGCTGSFNGSKGQIWITNGINNIRIYPIDIDKYPGYKRGRVMT